MGLGGMLGLFLSIVIHELAHSLVAKRAGLPIGGITLFVFGGVAGMEEEPERPGVEFAMAIAGPITSLVLAALFWGIAEGGEYLAWPMPLTKALAYLALINAIVAGFNLIPAFPLDGGRVLRSIIWGIKGDIKTATRWASRAGRGLGLLLIILGIATSFLGGSLIGGVWYVLIGLFIRGAASGSYRQMMVKQALSGATVGDFMAKDVVSVPGDASVQSLVEDYMYKHHFKMFPVTSNGRLEGLVSTKQVKPIPREEWGNRKVDDIAVKPNGTNTISPDTEVFKALREMNKNQVSRMLVVDGEQLKGVIALKDILHYLNLQMELEEGEESPFSR